jgi:hypothetical protein
MGGDLPPYAMLEVRFNVEAVERMEHQRTQRCTLENCEALFLLTW